MFRHLQTVAVFLSMVAILLQSCHLKSDFNFSTSQSCGIGSATIHSIFVDVCCFVVSWHRHRRSDAQWQEKKTLRLRTAAVKAAKSPRCTVTSMEAVGGSPRQRGRNAVEEREMARVRHENWGFNVVQPGMFGKNDVFPGKKYVKQKSMVQNWI